MTQAAQPAQAAPPPRPLRLLRSAPKIIWLLVVVHGLLLLSWSILTPIYHAPDESAHVDAVVRLYDGKGWPVPGKAFFSDAAASAWAISPYAELSRPLTQRLQFPTQLHLPQGAATPRSQRPHWNQLAARYPLPASHYRLAQQMVQHPPLYYAIQAGVLHALPGSSGYRWDVWVAIMRLVSVLMMTGLPLFAWAICRAVSSSRAAGICAALTPFAIPQLSHIAGSVNNDNALTLFVSLALVGCACALRGNRSLTNAAFVGVSLGLALLSKSPAVVLLPIVLACYLIGRRGEPVLKPLAMVYGLGLAIGGWWYVLQKVRTGSFQPSLPNYDGGSPLKGQWNFVHTVWHFTLLRFWGSAGRFEVTLPWRTAFTATILTVALTSYALLRSPGWRRRAASGVFLFPVLGLWALVFIDAYGYWRGHGKLVGIQGRYLFSGIAGLAATIGFGIAALPAAIRRWAPLAFAAGAFYLQWDLITRAIDIWWRPTGGSLHQAWGSLGAYAAWSPSFVRVVFVLTALGVIAAVSALLLTCVRQVSDGRGSVATARRVCEEAH